MKAELPTFSPKRKRRRFQFRLRTLLIGVTLLAVPCGYVGWQAKIVRARINEVENRFSENLDLGLCIDGYSYEIPGTPWFRRLLGDVTVYQIEVDPDAPERSS